jgi:hypothetical protein
MFAGPWRGPAPRFRRGNPLFQLSMTVPRPSRAVRIVDEKASIC